MRPSYILQATRRTIPARPKVLILPPLPLYRQILRAHKLLPPEQRLLGNEYVKTEFRLHKNMDSPAQIIAFLSSWQHYLECIKGDQWKLEKLDMVKIQSMSDDQIIQVSLQVFPRTKLKRNPHHLLTSFTNSCKQQSLKSQSMEIFCANNFSLNNCI